MMNATFNPNRRSTVVLRQIYDTRGPATSSHIREVVAFIDGVEFGTFDSWATAEVACLVATYGEIN